MTNKYGLLTILFAYVHLPIPRVRIKCGEVLGVSECIDTLVHTRQAVCIAYRHGIKFSIVDAEAKYSISLWGEYNWGSPLRHGRFDNSGLEVFVYFWMLALSGLRSCSVRRLLKLFQIQNEIDSHFGYFDLAEMSWKHLLKLAKHVSYCGFFLAGTSSSISSAVIGFSYDSMCFSRSSTRCWLMISSSRGLRWSFQNITSCVSSTNPSISACDIRDSKGFAGCALAIATYWFRKSVIGCSPKFVVRFEKVRLIVRPQLLSLQETIVV